MRPIFMNLKETAHAVSLSTASIQKMVRENVFPKPRLIAGRRVAWLTREVEEWAESRPISDNLPPPNTGHPNARRKEGNQFD